MLFLYKREIKNIYFLCFAKKELKKQVTSNLIKRVQKLSKLPNTPRRKGTKKFYRIQN